MIRAKNDSDIGYRLKGGLLNIVYIVSSVALLYLILSKLVKIKFISLNSASHRPYINIATFI